MVQLSTSMTYSDNQIRSTKFLYMFTTVMKLKINLQENRLNVL